MNKLIYITFCGLHFSSEVDVAVYNIIEDTAKLQASNEQDFKDKFNMIRLIIADKRTEWLCLSFVPDYYKATECNFKNEFMSLYTGNTCKEVNTFIWSIRPSRISIVRKMLMIEALKTSVKYKIRTVDTLDPIRSYLDEFEKLFLKSVEDGVFMHGDLTNSSIVKPHVYTVGKVEDYPYEYCKWECDDNAAAYSQYYQPGNYWATAQEYVTTTADTGTVRK